MKQPIQTSRAPQAIGPYSQAIQVGNTVYLSGQIPLIPTSMTMVENDIVAETRQVMENLRAVCEAAQGDLNKIVKLVIFLTDLVNFTAVNNVLKTFLTEPYPARSTIQVAALPKNARIEIEAIMILD